MMVRNKSLNKLKHEQVKKEYAEDHLHIHEEANESSVKQIVGRELEQKLREAIDALPEQCKLIFKMSRFEELKYAEIASQLNLSVKTVENQMGKALRVLRVRLKEFLPLFITFWMW
jgi:RNA polymerase sigma-70 factor (ECF subfamily)